MARYYFHVRQDQAIFEDLRGGEFSDITAAWNWALGDAQAMVDSGELNGPIEHHWIDICDGTGATVASLPFVRVLQLH
jgi:hypothetical protein